MSRTPNTARQSWVEMDRYRAMIDQRLSELVPLTGGPSVAARHSLLAPAKRLRAVLTMAAAKEIGADPSIALDTACAVEMIHSSSLVFDDLPAMDDAATRRGIETPHVLFGDDVAILAGIGLLNGAYGVIGADQKLSADQRLCVIEQLTISVGWEGLVQGQALDLSSDIDDETSASVDDIHYGKTGALFVAAAVSGAIIGNAGSDMRHAMSEFGRTLGLAYQAFDDLLDQLADESVAGKPTGADGRKVTAMKNTCRNGHDVAAALSRAQHHLDGAQIIAKTANGENSILADFADQIGAHFDKVFGHKTNAA